MSTKNEWPISQEEMQNIAKPLAATISFVDLANKYCKKIESIASATFTHRCICPNPFHKNGSERSPSFYFSESNKFYKCFGCQINGDIFDFITLTEGVPRHDVISNLVKNGNSSLEKLQSGSSGSSDIDFANMSFELNLDLSCNIRKYLVSRKDTPFYEKECRWADAVFKRIDETFSRFATNDFQQIKSFHSQILLELSRRETLYDDAV